MKVKTKKKLIFWGRQGLTVLLSISIHDGKSRFTYFWIENCLLYFDIF